MKRLNLLAMLFAIRVLNFAAPGATGGGGQQKAGTYSPETVFASLTDWKASDFREHVTPEQAREMNVNGETLLHRAIEVGKPEIARMLVNQPYGLDPKETNAAGVSAIDLAANKGGDFDGIFKDIQS